MHVGRRTFLYVGNCDIHSRGFQNHFIVSQDISMIRDDPFLSLAQYGLYGCLSMVLEHMFLKFP